MSPIDDYLRGIAPDKKQALERVRKITKQIAPGAEETVSYGLATFKYKQKPLLYFGAFKNHLSLFPTSQPVEQFAAKLAGFDISKGTIRFTVEHQLPEDIIKDLVQARLNYIDNTSE